MAEAQDGLCRLTLPQRADLRHAANLMDGMEKLRASVDGADPEDEEASDRMALEMVSLLGLYRS